MPVWWNSVGIVHFKLKLIEVKIEKLKWNYLTWIGTELLNWMDEMNECIKYIKEWANMWMKELMKSMKCLKWNWKNKNVNDDIMSKLKHWNNTFECACNKCIALHAYSMYIVSKWTYFLD